jgi:hypothetical protein
MKSKLTTYDNGDKVWKLPNGNLHREDGPAIEFLSGFKIWWINGIQYTEQDYKYKTRSIKLKLLL